MKLSELTAAFRLRADDCAQSGNAWSDTDIAGFATQAQDEAAERSRCLVDLSTPAVCQLTLVEAQQDYALDPRVLDVSSARTRGLRCGALRPARCPLDELLDVTPQPGRLPAHYTLYPTGAGLHLVLDQPAPDPALVTVPGYVGIIDLIVVRRPLAALVNPDDVPEIPIERHPDLVYWMLYLAYSSRDNDVANREDAAAMEARFTLAFGEKIDANVRRKQLSRRAPVVRPARF